MICKLCLCALLVPASFGFIIDTFFGPPPKTVEQLDVDKYLGRWYQVYASQSVMTLYERGAVCVTADYTNGTNGKITVLNSENLNTADGHLKVIHGYVTRSSEPGKLTVHLEGVPAGGDSIPQIPQLPLETRVDKIKMAVLRLMVMNNRLYKYLYSSTFDVPDYEKQNILYNNETLYLQYQQYFTFDFNNPDFEFHRRQLDAQILCNRTIQEIIRNTRELYADICSPLYNKRKFITAKVFPNASQLNLPKTLPMTSVCDHLLSVYHYMYDPLIEEVTLSTVDELVESLQISIPTEKLEPAELADKPLPSNSIDIPTPVQSDETAKVSKPTEMPKVSKKLLVSRPTEKPSLVQLVESPKTFEPIEKSDPALSVEATKISKSTNSPELFQLVDTSKITEPKETPKPDKLVETPKISKSVEMPKPVQIAQTEISKSTEIHELLETSKILKSVEISNPVQLVETEISKPAETHKPVQLVETTKISVEITTQVQLAETSTISESVDIPTSVQLVETTSAYELVKESNVIQKHVSEVSATHSNKHNPESEDAIQNLTTEIITTKSVTKEVKVAKKRPREDLADSVTEKRQRGIPAEGTEMTDFLRCNVYEEMETKRQRIAQWIQACVTKPAGAKRKASLLNKPRKDHVAKRQKMTKVTLSSTVKKRVKTSRKKSKNKQILT